MEENKELSKSIQQFYELLKRCPDNAEAAYDFVAYLRSLLKIQSKVPLPANEIMTLLKKYKPHVFYTLKRMAKKNLMLNILTGVPANVDAAEERLKKLANS
ncbi:hypothetical protein [Pseudobacillus wudalianchiensis]|uniref:Uncharacterized protein n=1 Tax=Pseudobacillus wudalianchiensis TaxID=1743143 RepID=A0A1B9B9U4_9BACI|nr:hypothetical protein [Bacillus wudalianchiensis]OCA92866.1 hypothetical protein A8F95_04055 [Bacillus wudalianchiensis]